MEWAGNDFRTMGTTCVFCSSRLIDVDCLISELFQVVTHSGGNPGFSTRVAFLPRNDIGFAILVNADEKGAPIMDLLHFIVDKWVGKECSISAKL